MAEEPSKEDLLEQAEDAGLDLPKRATKAEIQAALDNTPHPEDRTPPELGPVILKGTETEVHDFPHQGTPRSGSQPRISDDLVELEIEVHQSSETEIETQRVEDRSPSELGPVILKGTEDEPHDFDHRGGRTGLQPRISDDLSQLQSTT